MGDSDTAGQQQTTAAKEGRLRMGGGKEALVIDQLEHTSVQLKSWADNRVEVSLTSEPVGEDKLCLKGRLLRCEDGLFIFRHVAADVLIRPHEAVTEVALEDGRYVVRLGYECSGLISLTEEKV